MGTYAELQDLYMQWNKTLLAYEAQVADTIEKFLLGMSTYLQAPLAAVAFHKIDERATSALKKYPDPDKHFRLLLERDKDGSWPFCFSVKVMTKNPVLVHEFVRVYFPVNFKLTQTECDFHFLNDAKRTFTCDLGSEKPFDAVYAYVYDVFDRSLRSKPWESPEKLPIGFDVGRG